MGHLSATPVTPRGCSQHNLPSDRVEQHPHRHRNPTAQRNVLESECLPPTYHVRLLLEGLLGTGNQDASDVIGSFLFVPKIIVFSKS